MTAAADCADDRQVLHRADGGKAAHQPLRALQAADNVPIAVQRPGKAGVCSIIIIILAKGRPCLAVEVDVGGEFAVDGFLPAVDRIGKPCQFRGGADLIDAVFCFGLGLGRAVPSLTGIGQCYRDGVVFGSGKAAADRGILRLGYGVSIGLAEVEFVAAVGLGLDGAAHGVGQRNRRIRRISDKLHLVRRQGSEGHVLIHVLVRDDDSARLGLITVLADRVGVHSGGDRILTVGAGDGCTAGILQDDLAILRAGDIERDGVDGGNGKVFQLDIIRVGTAEGQRQFIALFQHRAECLPLRFIVGCQECLASVLYSESVLIPVVFISIGKILEGHNARLSRRQLHSRCAIAFFALQIVPTSIPYRFKAVSCAVLGGDTVQAGKEIVKGQRLDELQAYGLGSLDHKTPKQGIAAIQLGRVGIVPGGESAVRAAARVGGDTAGRDGDGGLGGHALRLGDVEGHRLLCQLGQLDGLVHIGGRNIDRAGGRLIAELADGVGVGRILGSDIDILAGGTGRRLLVNGGVSLLQCYRRIIGGKLQGDDRQFDKGNGNGVVPLLGGKLLRYLFVAFLFHRIGVFFANR